MNIKNLLKDLELLGIWIEKNPRVVLWEVHEQMMIVEGKNKCTSIFTEWIDGSAYEWKFANGSKYVCIFKLYHNGSWNGCEIWRRIK